VRFLSDNKAFEGTADIHVHVHSPEETHRAERNGGWKAPAEFTFLGPRTAPTVGANFNHGIRT
jgi:hypothetical protein